MTAAIATTTWEARRLRLFEGPAGARFPFIGIPEVPLDPWEVCRD